MSNFDVQRVAVLTFRNVPGGSVIDETLQAMKCQGCQRVTAVVEQNRRGIHWYPAPGAANLDKQVNERVASCYDEGMRCLGIGANRAAAVMFRSALSLFVKDKGGPDAKAERHLKPALRHMKEDGSLHSSLAEWADHLNQLGNEGAHPEDYDDVTADEAAKLAEFVRHLIRHEYEMPAQLLRARGLLKEDEGASRDAPPDDAAPVIL
ncbi:DUF4145 domain-containing protein [Jiangella alkaliphila]|uniref:DUF4145 domain-containing protein n=1 Tax=Jiangella alkaliphila TaxID=419479 RepID=A0A1H2LNZ5_9ACTN|nr:DUF4145 domain-containing protein [Jiangella alkaliphila]SDU82564.1 protein of unknown function [Jiangella alkaliphila]